MGLLQEVRLLKMCEPDKLVEAFGAVDASDFPHFSEFSTLLEQALWVLWVAKEKLGIRVLSAAQVATVITEVMETSTSARGVTNAFNRARRRVHRYPTSPTSYRIMAEGKRELRAGHPGPAMQLWYVESGRDFSSKRILCQEILAVFGGGLKVVDPYCGPATLDILAAAGDKRICFLTRLASLTPSKKATLMRQVTDFKNEHPNVEFRDYSGADLHDRYIIEQKNVCILGHSMKDLGSKESFAIVLPRSACKNAIAALTEAFDRRWKQATPI